MLMNEGLKPEEIISLTLRCRVIRIGKSGGSFPRVISPKLETDHSPPPSVDVKNAWSYTSILPYAFMAWCLIKQWIRLHGVLLS
jgi:hypothetical protein